MSDLWQRLPGDVTTMIWRMRFRRMLEDRLERLTMVEGEYNRAPDIGQVMMLQSKLLSQGAHDDWQATEAHRTLQTFFEFYEAWCRHSG
jgi:hypothetical protein